MSESANATRIRLADGRAFDLPKPCNASEFCLPGNVYNVAEAGIVGFFDQESETGAIWYVNVQRWMLQQPLSRAAFEELLQHLLQIHRASTAAANGVLYG
jgi:hypothetical protein